MIGPLHAFLPGLFTLWGSGVESLLPCLCITCSVPMLCTPQDTGRLKSLAENLPERSVESGAVWFFTAQRSSFVGLRLVFLCLCLLLFSNTTLRLTCSIQLFCSSIQWTLLEVLLQALSHCARCRSSGHPWAPSSQEQAWVCLGKIPGN